MCGETSTWLSITAVITMTACVLGTLAYMDKCKESNLLRSAVNNTLLDIDELENSLHGFSDYSDDEIPADQDEDMVQSRLLQRLARQTRGIRFGIGEEWSDRSSLVEKDLAKFEISCTQKPTGALMRNEKTSREHNNTPAHDTPRAKLSDDSDPDVSDTVDGRQQMRMNTLEAIGYTSPTRASRTSQSSDSSWAAIPEVASDNEDDIVSRVRHQLRACIGDDGAMQDFADILSTPEGGTLRSVPIAHAPPPSHRRSALTENPSEASTILHERQSMSGNVPGVLGGRRATGNNTAQLKETETRTKSSDSVAQ